tara:strand:- start:149 stop:1024 length:876 start_codon:yes stop_codon:yes gene_type:complete
MKILISGSSGQLGTCISKKFDNALSLTKKDLDLTNSEQIEGVFLKHNPEIFINCSAYTDVDASEKNKKKCSKINTHALNFLSEECKKNNCLLIHFSTDYVFDGSFKNPITETDVPKQINHYGFSKYMGEKTIKSSGCNFIIFRVSSLFSEFGKNFVKTMILLLKNQEKVEVVDDQIMCPTDSNDIAEMIFKIIDSNKLKKFKNKVYHFCGKKALSWYEFSKIIFDQGEKIGIDFKAKLVPIRSKKNPNVAERPKYSVLDCSNIDNDLQPKRLSLEESVTKILLKSKDGIIH